jgi:hypothetical protein
MPQQSSTTRFLIAFFIGILLAIASWFLVLRPAPVVDIPLVPVVGTTTSVQTPASASTANPAKDATVATPFGTLGVTGGGKIEVVQTPANPSVPAPSYVKPLVFSESITSDIKTALTAQFTENQKILAKNKFDFNAWIDLGMLRKLAGDYQGAKEIWEYVGKVWPQNTLSFANLGDLYQNFLHDYAKADASYKLALKNNPSDATLYRALFDLYSNTTYKPTATAAVDILTAGVAKNPAALDLHVLLARYYVKAGNPSAALIQYDAAIALSHEQGNTAAESDLKTEAAPLR